ncbi:MAG TPA: plastocyanin/azurin family copper-binding protein [Candidatus Acidoferrum sp.]|nr:plastocyanin/azurin family copper-binding protein [Candidatus Acidoferrum sp.]
MHKLVLGLALAAPVLLLAAAAGAAGAPQTVKVVLTDSDAEHMTLQVDRSRLKAGQVTFDVVNQSQDTIHEMLVLRTDSAGQPLPYDAKDEKVIEENTQDLGEVADLDPGKGGTLTLDLQPGHYLLICNQPGHFMHGMKADLTVAN